MRKRVLIVDDEPHIGQVFSIKLRHCGYDVSATTSGAEAIELIRTHAPDIVLLDVIMPNLTGFEVLERVRAFSSVPIVVFTGRPDIGELAMTLGASDYVQKPLNANRLVQKITQVLGAANCQTS